MNNSKNIFTRYLIILLVALPNLFIFYFVFTPLTIYPVFGLFKLFFSNVSLNGNLFSIQGNYLIELIPACIAGSAYYLLFMLNLSVPKINLKKRLKVLLFSFSILLVLNILRIFLLTLLVVNNSSSFESIHRVFWYLGTTIFVVLIWFLQIKIFDIKEIPFYSDIKYLLNNAKKTKTSKKN